MVKIALILAVGIAIGYGYGFKDAKQHDVNVVIRLMERVGGATRDRVDSNIDAKMKDVEK
ncbi:MAG TPA: hypothetical protein VFY16_02650 [Gemmatimonadaceae bacterium]|jgi:hypothetical protein|nr:hypothetical protein [Gemmatimonadaceae bacterium]